MNGTHPGMPDAIVPELPRGANGIPEPSVEHEMYNDTYASPPAADRGYGDTRRFGSFDSSPDRYLPWIALGAVVLGTIGAMAGCMQATARHRHHTWRAGGGPEETTPPHGDKLHPRS